MLKMKNIKQLSDSEIRNIIFKSYLKKVKGEKLTTKDKANIEAWETMGKIQRKQEYLKE
jgi:hypothetical protein